MDNCNPLDTIDKQVAFIAMCFDSRLQTLYQKVVRLMLNVQNRSQKSTVSAFGFRVSYPELPSWARAGCSPVRRIPA